jgi:hypothetical protein
MDTHRRESRVRDEMGRRQARFAAAPKRQDAEAGGEVRHIAGAKAQEDWVRPKHSVGLIGLGAAGLYGRPCRAAAREHSAALPRAPPR